MAATPKLTSAMMQGGGVYDSIIGQTQTPRANEKVLMFLDRMAPSDPVDNVVVWTDDEEPADHRVHMLLPDHRRKPHKPSSLSIENEEILDELAQSEMSYPHDEYKKASGGPRRSADDRHRREASLEDFGARGWTPKPMEMSSPENAYAMPSARPAGAHSRPGSRVPSRMDQRRPGSAAPPSRPPSVRPAHNHQGNYEHPRVGGDEFGTPKRAQDSPQGALEIDIREPSADGRSYDGNGVRSLPNTEPDLYAAGSTTPRMKSPPPPQPTFFARRADAQVAPLKSPFRTPQAAAAVALPGSRAPSAMGSRPASRMSAQHVRGEDLVQPRSRVSHEPMTAAAFETPWFHRTQYGKQEPPTVVSTLRLKLVSPPPSAPNPPPAAATDPYSTPKLVINHGHVRIPKGQIKTPIVSNVDAAPFDEHVHGHIHEVVEQDSDVVVVREEDDFEERHGDIDGDDIGHHVQEHYDVVGDGTQRSTTPKARGMVLKAVSDKDLPDFPETEIVDVEMMNERQLVELLKTPAMRSELDYGDVAQRAMEMHHDEDLCVLLQAADDELQHPIVRKAVRKQIAARLRKLGLADDYDAVKTNPDMAARLHKEAYGSPTSMVTRRLPDDAPQWARILSDHVRELTRQMQASQINEPGQRLIMNKSDHSPTREYEEDSLHPGHAIDEQGMQYRPDTEADTEGLLNIEPPAAGLISPGEMLYDEEVYKLRKRNGRGSPKSHATWEIEEEIAQGGAGSVLAGEEGANNNNSDFYRSSPTKGRGGHRRQDSASQTGGNETAHGADNEGLDWVARYSQPNEPPPWLNINQRLLNWAVIWPFSELENSLKSCERGEQVDEVALTIWTSQIYKRYVRAQMTTQFPPQAVDKMFVPPNIADAINNAAYNGRHEEVAMMLKELWVPFGLKGHPKIILALTKHRREENHWVVHRFSLPDASIITYDTHLEKSLPDGRPLGWWFGIRIAFASDKYPPPDQVIQRMIRLHRPLQLQIDNSLSAAAIWRNLIMGSKADRLVDLERLRDLIRQEVKGIRSKKEQGKLSLGLSKSTWSADPRAIEA